MRIRQSNCWESINRPALTGVGSIPFTKQAPGYLTIVYWPGTIKPGVSKALLTQVDLYASLAQLVEQEVRPGDAPDSENHLDTWLGKTEQAREVMLEEAFTLGLRMGPWKYIHPQNGNTPDWLQNKEVEIGLADDIQLYNLDEDPGEATNIATEHPEIVKEMQEKLEKILR